MSQPIGPDPHDYRIPPMVPGHQQAPKRGYQGKYGYWGDVPLANWPQRVGGYLIDQAIGLAPMLLVLLVRGRFGSIVGTLLFPLPFSAFLGPGGATLLCLGLWFANTCVLGGLTGRSVGKRVVGISVYRMLPPSHVPADEIRPTPPGIGKAAWRSVLHLLDVLVVGIGFLRPVWEDFRRTFADSRTSTVVVKGEPDHWPIPRQDPRFGQGGQDPAEGQRWGSGGMGQPRW